MTVAHRLDAGEYDSQHVFVGTLDEFGGRTGQGELSGDGS
jgi:hypothetical protein